MKKLLPAIVLLLLITVAQAQTITVVRVNKNSPCTGSCNGASWATAYRELHEAMAFGPQPSANVVIQYWVAGGVYKPTSNPGNSPRIWSFIVRNNMQLHGGFAGTETTLAQNQHLPGNRTFLSGDIGVPQSSTAYTPSTGAFPAVDTFYTDPGLLDNSYCVVSIENQRQPNSIIISYITVTGGFAYENVNFNNPSYDYSLAQGIVPNDPQIFINPGQGGGGIFIRNSDVNISNCFFVGNYARSFGGGMFCDESNVFISTCTFANNFGRLGGGAAMQLNSAAVVVGSEFKDNISNGSGGGFLTVTFPNKTDAATGGGIGLSPEAAAQKAAVWAFMRKMKQDAGVESAPHQKFEKYLGLTANGLNVIAQYTLDPQFQAFAQDFATFVNEWMSTDALANKLAIEIAAALDPDPARTFQLANLRTQLSMYNSGVFTHFTSTKFDGNFAKTTGGGLASTHTNVWIGQSEFAHNSSGYKAGAIYQEFYQNAVIENSVIHHNTSAGTFSAMAFTQQCATQILNTTITNNYCAGDNGSQAVGVTFGSHIKMANSVLWNNSSTAQPNGGADIYTACPQLTPAASIQASGNRAFEIYGLTELISCDVQGLANLPPSHTDVVAGCEPWVNPLCIEQEFGAIDLGYGVRKRTGVVSIEPQLDANFYPAASSYCINHGNNYYTNYSNIPIVLTQDYNGNQRITGGNVDMGAREYNGTPVSNGIPGVIYVNENAQPGGDGTSWASAFKYLQSALYNIANSDLGTYTQVWVAKGTYYTAYDGNRTKSFTFPPAKITYYGGFAGTETSVSQRNFVTNPTIISGDIGTVGDSTDNAYHVFYNPFDMLASEIILDGFTVAEGNANGTGINAYGGGMYNTNDAGPAILNCVFKNNRALQDGGAMWTDVGRNFTNCSFQNNYAGNNGGALCIAFGGLSLDGCTFSGNAAYNGGAVYKTSEYNTTFKQTRFTHNSAKRFGGGIYLYNPLFTINRLENCLIDNNVAAGVGDAAGAGIYVTGNGALALYNCTVTKNALTTITGKGAGVFDNSVSIYGVSSTLKNSIVWNNTINGSNSYLPYGETQYSGLQLIQFNRSLCQGYPKAPGINAPTYDENGLNTDPLFVNPAADDFRLQSCSPAIDAGIATTGITVDITGAPRSVGNATDMGAYEFQTASTSAGNVSIPTPAAICEGSAITLVANFSGVQGQLDSVRWQVDYNDGNSLRTLYNNSTVNGAAANTLQLINVPVTYNNVKFRIIGYKGGCRIVSSIIPVYVYGAIIYVDSAAAPGGNGASWATAYNTIRQAVNAANSRPCGQIWVKKGTYNPLDPSVSNHSNDKFNLKSGVAIYGGFNGTETQLSQRNWVDNVTLITGNLGVLGTCGTIFSTNHFSLTADSTAVVDGFTLTNTVYRAIDITRGNGPTIANCNIINCTGNGYGGTAIYADSARLKVTNCNFTNCTNGAAVYAGNCRTDFTNCTFTNNAGGIIGSIGPFLNLTGCTFTGNTGTGSFGAGAVFSNAVKIDVYNCTFTNNSSNSRGGALYLEPLNYTPIRIERCAFTGNSAPGHGGAVYIYGASATLQNINLVNNIFKGNSGADGGALYGYKIFASVFNCVFTGNRGYYGGAACFDQSFGRIMGCSVVGNYGYNPNNNTGGGGLYARSTNLNIENCLLYYNRSVDMSGTQNIIYNQVYPDNINVIYNIRKSSVEGYPNGGVNGLLSPRILQIPDPLNNPLGGDVRLTACSPLINKGETVIAGYDTIKVGLDYLPRRYNNTLPDVGAYEFQADTQATMPVFVSHASNLTYCPGAANTIGIAVNGPGMWYSWQIGTPAQQFVNDDTINGNNTSALTFNNLNDSHNGLKVYVTATSAAGCILTDSARVNVYPNRLYVNKQATGSVQNGLSWATAFTDLQQALNTNRACDAQIWVAKGTYYPTATTNRDVSFVLRSRTAIYGGFAGNEDFLYERNWLHNPTILSGDLGIQGDFTDNSKSVVLQGGNDATAVLDGFIVKDAYSTAENEGANIYLSGASPTISNCTFTNDYGKANAFVTGNASFRNCSFLNSAGTGATILLCNAKFVNCRFMGNTGGGIHAAGGNPVLLSSVITGNKGAAAGGVSVYDGSILLMNTTISGNAATGDSVFYTGSGAGGVFTVNGAVKMVNTVVWNNSLQGTVNDNTQIRKHTTNAVVTASNCNIQNSTVYAGNGNINSDPLFVYPVDPSMAPTTDGEFALAPCSPLINAGDNSVVSIAQVDLDSMPRLHADTVDIGAYEFNAQRLQPVILPAFTIKDTTVCIIMPMALAIPDLGSGMSYQWQIKVGNSFVNLTAATTNVYSIPTVTPDLDSTIYRCVVTSATGCNLVTNQSIFRIRKLLLDFTGLNGPYCPGDAQQNTFLRPSVNGIVDGGNQWGSFNGPGMIGRLFYPDMAGPGTHNITYSYTDPNGCIASVSKPVVVRNAPNAEIVEGTFFHVCGPTTVTLTAPAAASYQWNTSGATTQSVAVSSSGLYRVTVTDANGCTGSTSVNANVIIRNQARPTISASGPLTFCAGEYVVLTASSHPLNQPPLWSTGQAQQVIGVSTSGSYSVSQSILYSEGTDITCTTFSDTVIVKVLPRPVAIITNTGADQLCSMVSTTLAADSGAWNYRWSTGDTTRYATVADGGVYRLTISNSYCGDSAQYAIKSDSVYAEILVPDGNNGCSTTGSTLHSAGKEYHYKWFDNNNNLIGTDTTQYVNTSGTYYMVATADGGLCADTSAPVIFNFIPAPLVTAIPAVVNICSGQSLSTLYNPNYSYHWKYSNTRNGFDSIYYPQDDGIHTLDVTDNTTGCTVTQSFYVVFGYANPYRDDSYYHVCIDSGLLYARPGGSMHAIGFQWSSGGNQSAEFIHATGTYYVTVSFLEGCQVVGSVTVEEEVTPTIAIALTQSGTCTGSTSRLQVTNKTYPGLTPHYLWFKNGVHVGTDSIAITAAFADGDRVQCKMISSSPCALGDTVASNIIYIHQAASYTPLAVISAAQNMVCNGTNATYTTQVIGGGPAPVYQWYKNGQPVGNGTTTYTTNSLNNGDVLKFTVTNNESCASPHLVQADSFVVTNQVAYQAPYITQHPSSTTICQGETVTITSTAQNLGPNPVYKWMVNNVVVSNDSTFTPSTLQNGDRVWLSILATPVCGAYTHYYATTNDVFTVLPYVQPTISIASSKDTICGGESLTFTATRSQNAGSYQWLVNGVVTGNATAPLVTTSLQSNDVVRCRWVPGLQCALQDTVYSNSITTHVKPSVTPTIYITVSDSSICSGEMVELTAHTTGAGAGPAHIWQVNGNWLNVFDSTITWSSFNNGDVISCQLWSSAECLTQGAADANQISMDVYPAVAPTVTVSASQVNTCAGVPVTFTAAITNGGIAPIYQWKRNGANVGTNSATFTTSTLSNNDVIACVLTSNLPCVTPTQATGSIVIAVGASATPDVTIQQSLTGCQGYASTFTAVAVNGGTSPAYQWKVNGVNAGANSPVFTSSALANGNLITCVLTSNAGCLSRTKDTSNAVAATVYITTFDPEMDLTGTASCEASVVARTANTPGTFSYSMYKQGGTLLTNNGSNPNFSIAVNGTYYLVTTDNHGCKDTSANLTINNVHPVTTISSATGTLCPGAVLTVPQQANCKYRWTYMFPNQPPQSVTNQHAIPYGGIWYVYVQDTVAQCADYGYINTTVASLQIELTGSLCESSATVQASDYNIADSYTWSTGYTSGSSANSYLPITQSGNYSVTASYNSGCTVAKSINVPAPVTVTPTIAINASQTAICGNSTITFNAAITTPGGSVTYQWRKNGQPVGTNSATYASNSFANNDVITCQLTCTSPCAIPAVVTSNAITLTVPSAVAPQVTINAPSPVCHVQVVQYTASVTNAGANPAYTWQYNGGNVGNGTATLVIDNLTNGSLITCTVTQTSGCNLTTTASKTVVVDSLLSTRVNVTATDTVMCGSTPVTFTATPINAGTNPVYQWQINGFNTGVNSPTLSTAALSSGDVVYCIVTGNATCPNPSVGISNSINIQTSQQVTPAITITQSSGTVCAGTPVSFTAQVINGGTAPVYQWKVNGANKGSNSATFTDSSAVNGAIVTCVLTSNALCASQLSVTSNAVAMVVSSAPQPTVSISASQNNVCAGTFILFTATASNAGINPVYQWYKNGVVQPGSGSAYGSAAFLPGDVVKCRVRSNLTCAVPDTAISNAVILTIIPTANPTISISGSYNVCAGATASFTATVNNGGSQPVYQWKVNGQTVGINTSVYSSAALVHGDVVTCQVTGNAACAANNTANSNAITMVVSSSVPSVVVVMSQNGSCAGSSFVFMATAVNGGNSPAYQWKVNGNNTGNGTSIFTTTGLADGDIVSCQLTSSVPCATPQVVVSNNVTVAVTSTVLPAISISSSSQCNGQPVVFIATATNAGVPVYQWKRNGANVGTNSATYTDSTLATNDTISCVLLSSLACASPATVASNNVVLSFMPIIQPVVTLSTNDMFICQGVTATVTADTMNMGGAASYQWFVNGISAGGNTASYSSNLLADNDLLSCVVTSAYVCAHPQTVTSDTLIMRITPTPLPAVIINENANNICTGTPVTFTLFGFSGGTAPVYQWKKNSVDVGSGTETYTDATLANGDTITCQMVSNQQCFAQGPVVSNAVVMVVSDGMPPTVSITESANGVCTGNTVTFTAQAVNGGSLPVYEWKVNGVDVYTGADTYVTDSLKNGDIITCVLTSNANCSTVDTATSNAIVISVVSSVTPAISINASANNVCRGNVVTFTANAVNAGTTPVYQWKVSGSNVGANAASYQSSTLTSSDIISCILTSSLTCASVDSAVSNNITVEVDTFGNTQPQITVNGTSPICQGESIELIAPAGNYTYLWSTNAQIQSVIVTITGSYTVTITNSNNCTAISNTVSVAVNPLPAVPVITQTGNTLSCTPAVSYQWYRNTVLLSGAINQSYSITQNGNYEVEITDANGCKNRSIVHSAVWSDIEDMDGDYTVTLYPNPNRGSFELVFKDNITRQVKITNALGQNVFAETEVTGYKAFDLYLAPGVYFVSVRSNNYTRSIKFTVAQQ